MRPTRKTGKTLEVGPAKEKMCSCCKHVKPVSEFYVIGKYKKTNATRYRSDCKKCLSLKAAVRWEENKDFKDRQKNRGYRYSLKKNYGLTEADYLEMYSKQEGVCAICRQPSELESGRLAVDHCHETGAIRGLLCRKCNSGLGLLNDSLEMLVNAINYLKEFKND
jgi:hypothetical protein